MSNEQAEPGTAAESSPQGSTPMESTGDVPMSNAEDDATRTNGSNDKNGNNKSALQDNIERKGKNAYYFAHAHKATGPAWDGKAEPRLLSKMESTVGHRVVSLSENNSTFDYSKSNITKYAFLDDGMKVKLYIDLENVGEKCSPDDVSLDFTEQSLSLVVRNYNINNNSPETTTNRVASSDDPCLSFRKLTAPITAATFRLKEHKIIITLTKATEGVWYTINDKGTPDHEVV